MDDLTIIENRLKDLLKKRPSSYPILSEAMEYSLLSGGKRLRPLFILNIVKAINANRLEEAIAAGLAIECIHTYSLIHDDLPCMDNDDMRRGKPTLHKAFGQNIALLAGDALLTLSFEIIGSIKITNIIERLAQLIGYQGMIRGQVIDVSLLENNLSKDTIFELYELKTAALFIASLEMGAMIVSDNPKLKEALSAYGKMFGIAFQIADDIEDFQSGKKEKITASIPLNTLISWYEETKISAKKILKTIDYSIPFLEEVFDLLDEKVLTT
jgi:geranylgeranyl diphosphate synthase type II